MSLEPDQERFQSLSLEDSQETKQASAGTTTEDKADSEEIFHSLPPPNDEGQADLDAPLDASSVERSLERTVNLSTEGLGFVSLSPVEERDLFVTVDDPQIHPSGSFVTYAVTTKTSRQTFAGGEFVVRRRYQDFIWLRDQLERTFETHIIPPLPEKYTLTRIVSSDHFTPEFLAVRQAALQKFLSRVVDHPTVSFDRHLHVFLTAKDHEFQTAKGEAVGFFEKMSTSVRSAASMVLLKQQDPEFAALHGYFNALEKHLNDFESTGVSIMQERADAIVRQEALSSVCRQWSAYETELRQPLSSLADCFDANAKATQQLDEKLSPAFAPFHEYLLFCESAKSVLKRRDALQMDYELAQEDVVSRETTLNQVKQADTSKSLMSFFSDPEQLKKDRIAKAEDSLQLAQAIAERTNDDMECANEHLRADLMRWQNVKKHDLASTFVQMADLHVNYFKQCLEAWEDTIRTLEDHNSGEPQSSQS